MSFRVQPAAATRNKTNEKHVILGHEQPWRPRFTTRGALSGMFGFCIVEYTCECVVALQISLQHCLLQNRQRNNSLCRCLRDRINCNAYAQKRLSPWSCNYSCREYWQRPCRSLPFGPIVFDIIQATRYCSRAKKSL